MEDEGPRPLAAGNQHGDDLGASASPVVGLRANAGDWIIRSEGEVMTINSKCQLDPQANPPRTIAASLQASLRTLDSVRIERHHLRSLPVAALFSVLRIALRSSVRLLRGLRHTEHIQLFALDRPQNTSLTEEETAALKRARPLSPIVTRQV
jgi:hypothetical protein